ncbi:CaiB/BaiF CoA-transferase family protein [Halioxenophilus sp. WMMB6]|uniref:CaiB/BaiF CoA transferase family protein n=1 Tax=Halioxenophilus sp. WMMB6 TaxID=3073815 RepID=UPI00295E4A8D|nr:CaiB/BaiF CoA-transferase family protein [Halioxenophilus sp. WMMB6]
MGPLNGFTVIELAGIGPAPMAGMMLADMGASVIRIERSLEQDPHQARDASHRGKQSVVLNLKSDQGRLALLRMVEKADVLIEGYRPGITEKMGIGPEDCWQHNPRLVYGRMTGWGQVGPLSHAAGHDINYIALTGALYACGRQGEAPTPPLNLVGDMGGGGMLLVSGVLAALLEAQKSGQGQVVDAAMLDGAAQLMWMFHGFHAQGMWNAAERGVNILDGGAHFYSCYETADGKYIALGAIEPQFYALLMEKAELDPELFAKRMAGNQWPNLKTELAKVFKSKTQQEWNALLEGTDACYAPVLSMTEAPQHPHNIARNTYMELDGFIQPAPAPRFSRTPSEVQHGKHQPGEDGATVLAAMGFSTDEIAKLLDADVLQQP